MLTFKKTYSTAVLLTFLLWLPLSVIAGTVNNQQFTLQEAIAVYEDALQNSTSDDSRITLDFIENKFERSNFHSQQDWSAFLIHCEERIHDSQGSAYPEVCFRIGKYFLAHQDFHKAYYYLYRTEMLLKNTTVSAHQPYLSEFHETIGLSYYYFKRYAQAKQHFFQAIAAKPASPTAYITIYNTIGLIYRDAQQLDSSRIYFVEALDMATKHNKTEWKGVISGNLGYYYWKNNDLAQAEKLCQIDLRISLASKQYGSAIGALTLLADIDISNNRLDMATQKLHQAFEILQENGSATNRRSVYRVQTLLLEKKGDYRGALESHRKYIAYKDSVNQEIDLENFNNTEFQINFEKKQAEIALLDAQRAKGEEFIIWLYVFISTIIVAFFIILLQVRKKRQKGQKILVLEKLRVEEELVNTDREMRAMLSNLMEKNELVDQLREEIEAFHTNQDEKSLEEKEKLFDRLQRFTLLTEEDWLEFKKLFERLNPGFFDYFTREFPDMTNAEIRLATLIKLNLSNLEMAKTLGISPDSVRKTNLRLRKKLDIEQQDELISFIKSVRGQ
jgi:tetratricopeptide (TPR) repeat protein